MDTYEKKYKEAMKACKELSDAFDNETLTEELEKIFPELGKSEDERIRKELISFVRGMIACHDKPNAERDEKYESWIAWLEKQGEQKPSTDFSDIRTWKYIVDAVLTEKEGIGQYLDSPFTEEIAKKLQKRFGNIEQKPTWSEEDEQYLLVCKNALAKYQVSDKWDAHIISHWLENKLKSLRPQNRWKPSDEQMEAMQKALVDLCGKDEHNIITGLYYDLKKIREE